MNGKVSTKLYELFIDRSWQHITFEKRPVAFVKIIGTSNTANEVRNPFSKCIFVTVPCKLNDEFILF